MVLAERLAVGYGDDDPFVIGWREELACDRPLQAKVADLKSSLDASQHETNEQIKARVATAKANSCPGQ